MEKGGAGGEGEGERECAVCIRASLIGAATNGHRRERERDLKQEARQRERRSIRLHERDKQVRGDRATGRNKKSAVLTAVCAGQ